MKRIDKLTVKYNGTEVGILSLTPDNKLCTFEYDKVWPGGFIANAESFYGNFGIFEDSLPDGYGRYLLHKAFALDIGEIYKKIKVSHLI